MADSETLDSYASFYYNHLKCITYYIMCSWPKKRNLEVSELSSALFATPWTTIVYIRKSSLYSWENFGSWVGGKNKSFILKILRGKMWNTLNKLKWLTHKSSTWLHQAHFKISDFNISQIFAYFPFGYKVCPSLCYLIMCPKSFLFTWLAPELSP